MGRLQFIAAEESIKLDEDASRMLAKLAQGGMRDAISLLELCAGGGRDVTLATVEDAIGLTGRDSMLKTVLAVADKNYDLLFAQIDEVVRSSKDIAVFWQDLIAVYRDMLVVKTTKNAAEYLDLTDYESKQLYEVASRFRKETLLYHCKLLEDALFAMQKANAVKRIVAEMALVRMCDEALDSSGEALLSRIAQIEEKLITGSFVAAHSEKPAPSPALVAEEKPTNTPAPTSVPTVSAPVASAPVADAFAPKSASGEKRVLKPMRNWMEAVEKISRSDPMRAGFVKNAQAYTMENGSVVVRFPDPFTFSMMEKDEARDRLRMALSTVLRREVGDRMLIMEVAGEKKNSSVIDEILDLSDETEF